MKPTYIIIHHTASDQMTTTLEQVNSWHKARGFTKSNRGYYVGYHFIFLHDKMVQTRDEDEIGCHTLGGWNYKSIGMCFAGNFDVSQALTSSQQDEFIKTIRIVMKNWNIPIENVLLHRDCWATACPGHYIDKNFIHNLINKKDNMELKENYLYQLVEGKGGFGIVVDGKLLIDEPDKILATFIMRNGGNISGKTIAVNQADWDSVEHYNLKKEKIK